MATHPRGEPLLEYREYPVAHWRVTPAHQKAHSEAILVHGLGEHAGRMMPVARRLTALGYNCRVPDLPGHGGHNSVVHRTIVEAYLYSNDATEILGRIESLSPADRQLATEEQQKNRHDLYRTSFDSIIEVITELTAWSAIDGNDANRPQFLWGHSMGGLAAFHAAAQIDRDVVSAPTGLILSAPALAPPPQDDDLLLRLVTTQALVLSSNFFLRPIAALQRLTLRILGIEEDGRWSSQYVSDLPAEQLLHVADPYHGFRIPLCFASRLLPPMASARQKARELRTPTFIFAAGFDPIVNTRGSRKIAASLSPSFDHHRPHRLDINEDMKMHDLARSSGSHELIQRIHYWMQGGN